jgi:hypothetical protein
VDDRQESMGLEMRHPPLNRHAAVEGHHWDEIFLTVNGALQAASHFDFSSAGLMTIRLPSIWA